MTQRCDAYQGDFFYRFCVFLTPWVDAHCGDLLSSMMKTAESDLAMGYTPRRFYKIHINRRNQKELKNTSACLSGVRMGLNREKNRGQKSGDTLPLKEESRIYSILYCIM